MVKNIRPVGGDWRAYCSELGDFEEVTVIQQSRFFSHERGAEYVLPRLDNMDGYLESQRAKLVPMPDRPSAQGRMFLLMKEKEEYVKTGCRLMWILRVWFTSRFVHSATNSADPADHVKLCKEYIAECNKLLGESDNPRHKARATRERAQFFKTHAATVQAKAEQKQNRWRVARERGAGPSKAARSEADTADLESVAATVANQVVDRITGWEDDCVVFMAESVKEVLEEHDPVSAAGDVDKTVRALGAKFDSMPVERIFKELKPDIERQQNTFAELINAKMTVRHGRRLSHTKRAGRRGMSTWMEPWLKAVIVQRGYGIVKNTWQLKREKRSIKWQYSKAEAAYNMAERLRIDGATAERREVQQAMEGGPVALTAEEAAVAAATAV